MMAELAQRLAPLDLRISECAILMMLGQRGDLTSAEIGKVLDIQRANMAPMLKRMELAGLIARKPIDGRSMAIVLTKVGTARRALAHATLNAFEAELMSRIPARHRHHFMPALYALWKPAEPD
ncbi:MAG: MarR family transcriptional regulator [Alphaproteobacteria bacterium]|nr:MarR family transcriptional regulator [Alphaproteobacteria bacterium]